MSDKKNNLRNDELQHSERGSGNTHSLEIINLNNCDIIKSINSYYKDNISCLNNGVLTSSQKLKFAKL